MAGRLPRPQAGRAEHSHRRERLLAQAQSTATTARSKSTKTDYRALVKRTKDALPDVKLVICEPFVLKVGAVDDSWFPDFDGYRAAASRVAEEAKAAFVPFQTMFDLRRENRAAGDVGGRRRSSVAQRRHALMAHWWLKGVGAHG